MRRLFNRVLGREKKATVDLPIPTFHITGPVQSQSQSTLFSLLSKDVRLLNYEASLADPSRLLHIVRYRGKLRQNGMGHWHCMDEKSPYPTWQHSCFGISGGSHRRKHRLEPRSNSNLVPLLLVCRLV
jgi:hypothetical protein